MTLIRRFDLHRDVDVSGLSGVGRVASGIRIGPWAFMTWHSKYRTVTWYARWQWVEVLHGHEGQTHVIWR